MAKSVPESFDPETESKTPKTPVNQQSEVTSSEVSTYPGQTLGIVALVFAFFMPLPALALGITAWVWSHKAGKNNILAKVSVFVSGAFTVIGVFLLGLWVALVSTAFGGFYGGPLPGDRIYVEGSTGMIHHGDMDDMMHEFDQLEGEMKNMLPAPGDMPQMVAPQSN